MAHHPETNPHFVRQQPRQDDRPWPNPSRTPDDDPHPRSRDPQVHWMPDAQQPHRPQEVPLMVPHPPEERHTRWFPRTRRISDPNPRQPKPRRGTTPPLLVPERHGKPRVKPEHDEERLPDPRGAHPPRQDRHFLPSEHESNPRDDHPPRQDRHFLPPEHDDRLSNPRDAHPPRQNPHFLPPDHDQRPSNPRDAHPPRQDSHFLPPEHESNPRDAHPSRQNPHFLPPEHEHLPSNPRHAHPPRPNRHFLPETHPTREQRLSNPRHDRPPRQSRHFQPLEPPRRPESRHGHGQGLWAPTSRKTKPLTWFAAVFCVIFWLIIILGGIIVLIVYLVFRPRSPKFEVSSATLNAAYLDMGYLLNADLTLLANFTNPNKKVSVDFSYMIIDLYYGNTLIATQYIDPFSAENLHSKFQTVHLVSSQVRLPIKDSQRLQRQMAGNGAVFEVKGVFRTRSRLGSVLRYSYWLYGHCRIVLTAPPTGVLRASYCRTKR